MNIANLTKAIGRIAGRSSLIFKKHSPEILLVVGIAGTITSTVLACKATLKVDEVLDAHKDNTEKINSVWAQVQTGDISESVYSEQDHKKDLSIVYVQTSVKVVRLFAPAVLLGAASIACIIGGHTILRRRNIALVAAYKAVEEGFNAYRARVVAERGTEEDYNLRHGIKAETLDIVETGDDGETREYPLERLVVDPNGLSIYARFFDESCDQWSKTPEYNLMFLKAQQTYFNQMLQARGHVFLNEVYDALGIPRTKAGTVVGWVMGHGDSYIDFGIFDGDRPPVREFINGYEKAILLDFNVDGVIYDLFTKRRA